MLRISQLMLTAILALMGVLMVDLGIRVWLMAQRTTETIFDATPNSDPDALRCGCPDPWFDMDYILHKAGAMVILLIGIVIFIWAMREIFSKRDDATA